ncbi:MAG: nucleotidyltransferase [Clostridiales Family XIII bacterium]|jgi:hypothetical protein|nr:nucleotidyltransferase [Clostridiales Family XIII bacterium]
MKREPLLIVMAAGLGSRYGGLKQMDPINGEGEIIIDFSLYDAVRAGFRKAVFVIKREMEGDFRGLIDGRAGGSLDVAYAFQELADLPEGYGVPEGRVRPWGTCHAVYSCRHLADGPFAVINADDYYGAAAFRMMREHLENAEAGERYPFAMAGYPLGNTLTEHGFVARGVCETDGMGRLLRIVERKKVMRRDGRIMFLEGEEWGDVPADAVASMNFWGFTQDMMGEIGRGLPAFLDGIGGADPLAAEYLLPSLVGELLEKGRAEVRVLMTDELWHGVTYREDRPAVSAALQALKDRGLYPARLWGGGTKI